VDHLHRAQQAALLHHLDLHDVGRLAADDVDQRRRPHHALVGHERDGDPPADLRQVRHAIPRHWLLHEHEVVGLEPLDERDGVREGQGLVEVHAERHAPADRLAHRGHALEAHGIRPVELDLRRPEPTLEPSPRFFGGLSRRHGPDPGVNAWTEPLRQGSRGQRLR
jgi:hypothetical protein